MVFTAYLLVSFLVWTGMADKYVPQPCDRLMFESNVDDCLSDFNKSMEANGFQDSCPWPAAKGIYNQLKLCVDNSSEVFWCRGSLVDEVFLRVHRMFFTSCGQVQDPSLITVVMLVVPSILFTLLLPFICAYMTPSDTKITWGH
ncbi:receptor activity-modifying protein 1 isoform X2 [Antennarius striatus]|uniref:receptor activity-modifying protein 1 isoform X2 n=1 Tax=Antennarius striatus TaxID=241820 RepID=UPI0035AE741E